MKIIIMNLLFFCFATLCHAGLLYQYHELALMDLDQMTNLVQDKIKESKKASAKTVPLKEGMQAVYARPDSDRMIDKVISPLRLELEDLGSYQRIINELVDEATNALKNTRNFKPSVQVTYMIFLENLMADVRRAAADGDNLERKLLLKIKKAKIKLTKEALNERRVRSSVESRSPSDIASDILQEIEAAAKAADEKAKEEIKK
jgi:hypothetical protein